MRKIEIWHMRVSFVRRLNSWCGIVLAFFCGTDLGNKVNAGADSRPQPSAASVVSLRTEYMQNPQGVDSRQPNLSWIIDATERNWKQGSYQVLVASTADQLAAGIGDLWDSGRVESVESTHIQYGGKRLTPRLRCHWKVRVWDRAGRVTRWSAPGMWEMGLLGEWQAKWIGADPAAEPERGMGFLKRTNELKTLSGPITLDGRSTLLRKTFLVTNTIRQARVYVTGLGYYELSCNGKRVGDRVLAPAKSNYAKWILYDTYDLTPHLRLGTNALGIMLGNGWFNPYPKWWDPYRMQWFGSKRALLQLHIDHEDSSSQVVVSDSTWESAPGPVLSSCVYDGEEYDATEERTGWDEPGNSLSGWQPAQVVRAPGGVLVSHLMPAIRVTEYLRPKAVSRPAAGVYVFDLGQNFTGWVRLKGAGQRGAKVRLRYAEDLRADGNLDVTSNEKAASTDVYVFKGGGVETYEPRFTFHGFRYVEVTGFPGEPNLDSLVGCVVNSDCPATGTFSCSDDLVNRIHRATWWSQRSNLMGYPMDCPQRDERLGWFGDAMVSMEEAMFNFDMPQFYRQWLDGVRLNQNPTNGDISIISPRPYVTEEPDPTWSSAYVVMVWNYYVHYGDRAFLAEHFESMRRYVDFLGNQATNHILPKYWIGDWGTIVKGWKEGEPVSVATAFYYYDAVLLGEAAAVLGKENEAKACRKLAGQIREAFNRTFYDPANREYENGTLFSSAFPLFLGLVPASREAEVMEHILRQLERNQGRFDVGVLGAKYLIDALSKFGRSDVAYSLAGQTGYPSWAHMLEGGRTTLSEFWDLHGSHNHVMMGSIDGWFYRALAGIQPDEKHAGYREFRVRPFVPESLSYVSAAVDTVRGRIEVDWRKHQGELTMRVRVPGNSAAEIYVPCQAGERVRSSPPLSSGRFHKGTVLYRAGSGIYEFSTAWP